MWTREKEITVQVEWVESLLLFQATYHKYDDVTRMHNFQMRREISVGTYVDDTGLEEGGADDYPADAYSNGKRDYHGSEYAPRSYDYGYTGLQERAFSTDTDYA
ncbi:hypothetical protein O3P69_019544 [Scylla paramamosain]|uniref:Uncharacterized protein n=1 Tax=Scylla paramamosain TaxID=85552 RepID=A0AAW0SX76_SCYPA